MTITAVENTYATFSDNKESNQYTHYFDINVAIRSACEEGGDISSKSIHKAFLAHIQSIAPEDFIEHCNLFATDPIDK